jgi:lipopolysaccharide export system protein LptA
MAAKRKYQLKLIKKWLTCLTIAGWLLTSAVGQAAEGITKAAPESAAEKIQVTADQLMTDNQNRYAEFSGDVIARQGSFEIRADRLRIYYKAGLKTDQSGGAGQDAIEKIIAEGNVRIEAEDNTAQTEKAEYSVADMQIVLIGDESKVVTGKNSITGAKIVYNRKEGWIRVEKGENKRVRAVFYPDEKTMPGEGKKEKD